MADATLIQPTSGLGSTAMTNQLLGKQAFNEATGAPTVVTNANVVEKGIPQANTSLAKANSGTLNNSGASSQNGVVGKFDASGNFTPGRFDALGNFTPTDNSSNGGVATPNQGSSMNDVMDYVYGTSSEADKNANLKSSVEATPEYQLIAGLKTSNDASYNQLVKSIQEQYAGKFQTLATAQNSTTAGINQSLEQSGANRYAPVSASGIISAKQTADITELNNLQHEEDSLLAQANSAKSANDYKTVQDTLALYDKKRQEKLDQANKIMDNLKAEKDKINSIATDAKKAGADDATVKKILGSVSEADAINNAGDSLQTATGDFADYPQYKKDALASGVTPLDATSWLAQKQKTDLANKTKEAYGTAFATAKGKAAGELAASGGSGSTLPVVSNSGVTYQVPSSVAPYVKIAPNGVKYVDASGLTAAEKGTIMKAAYNNGVNPIPVITDPSFALDVSNIADATLKLKDMKEAFNGVTTDSAAARDTYYAAAIKMASALQTNPAAVGLDIYQDAALDILKAMSGTKGFRGGASMVDAVKETFPKKTDTTAVVNQKIANMQKLIDDRQSGLIGSPSASDKVLIDQKKAEDNLTSTLLQTKATNPTVYKAASAMYTSNNPTTGQPYTAADILQAFPELSQ